jgi:hypothetical protein
VSDFRPEPKQEPIDWSARVREAERNGELPEEEPYDLTQLRGYEPVHPESPLRSFLRKLWVPIAFVGALFWKFKAVAVAVLKFKFLATALSGLVSIAAYALLWGWWFAVGLGRAPLHPRDGTRARGPTAGTAGERADVHPVPRCADRAEAAARRRRGARRASRSRGPIVGTLGACVFWIIGAATQRDFFTRWHTSGSS